VTHETLFSVFRFIRFLIRSIELSVSCVTVADMRHSDVGLIQRSSSAMQALRCRDEPGGGRVKCLQVSFQGAAGCLHAHGRELGQGGGS